MSAFSKGTIFGKLVGRLDTRADLKALSEVYRVNYTEIDAQVMTDFFGFLLLQPS